jgi:hypothetical protein
MISEAASIAQSERTASRTLEGRAVVVVIDDKQLHTLNAVGSRIWELADGRALSEIVETITREFAVDREQALADTRKFVEELRQFGALVVDEAAP